MMILKLPLFKVALCLCSIFLIGCGSSGSDSSSVTDPKESEQSTSEESDYDETLTSDVIVEESGQESTVADSVVEDSTVSEPSAIESSDSEQILTPDAVAENTEETSDSDEDLVSTPVTESKTVDLNITWYDNSDNEDEFIIERRLLSNVDYGTIYYTEENITSYNDLDVQSGETYCYRISASNIAGQSPSSETCIEL